MDVEYYGAIRDALVAKESVPDTAFDRMYPPYLSKISSTFWTPIKVARRASAWLTGGGARRVLDVGAGVGKFCIVGSLTTGVEFVGVEHRPHIASVARNAICRIGAHQAHIVDGNFVDLSWHDYDAFYFYNPFQENTIGYSFLRLDESVELTARRFHTEMEKAQAMLDAAPLGTRVATYHGLGGDMPNSYALIPQQESDMADLEFWLKRSSSPTRKGHRSTC